MLYAWLVLSLAVADLSTPFRWATPYPDGRTQNFIAVASPDEFFTASANFGGINHYSAGVWKFIPPSSSMESDAKLVCFTSLFGGGKLVLMLNGSSLYMYQYNVAGAQWSGNNLAIGGANIACSTTETTAYVVGSTSLVVDLLPVRIRNTSDLCHGECKFLTTSSSGRFALNSRDLLWQNETTNWTAVVTDVKFGLSEGSAADIEAFVSAPDGTLYAAYHGNFAVSTNGGQNWTALLSQPETDCGTDPCRSTGLYATNALAFFSNHDPSRIFVYNKSAVTPRNAPARSAVISVLGNQAFFLGAFGSVWKMDIATGTTTSFNRELTVDVDPWGGPFTEECCLLASPFQLVAISGYGTRVYGLTNSLANPIMTATLPFVSNWTWLPGLPPDSGIPRDIWVDQSTGTVWVLTNNHLCQQQSPWGCQVLASDVTFNKMHGTSGFIIIVGDSSTMLRAGPSVSWTSVTAFGDNNILAVYVHNSTLWFTGDVGSTNHLLMWRNTSGLTSTLLSSDAFSALYYHSSLSILFALSPDHLWSISVANLSNLSAVLAVDGRFDCIFARSENDIYATGSEQNAIWHSTGGNWTSYPVPTTNKDSWMAIGNVKFGVRGIWGPPLTQDLYLASKAGILFSPVTTSSPTRRPTVSPTKFPSSQPTKKPTRSPTTSPTTRSPTASPTTRSPTFRPTRAPSTSRPTKSPTTKDPTPVPTVRPTRGPTTVPTRYPTVSPTTRPSRVPTSAPSRAACVCVDDCIFQAWNLSGNGICEDVGEGVGGRSLALAACAAGHDCSDCGPSNRTAFKVPYSCVDGERPHPTPTVNNVNAGFSLFNQGSLVVLAIGFAFVL